jgi:rare lipoprotein A
VGDLRTTPDGGLIPPAQMFALCGVMIIVGIVYIANAPTPAPAEPVAITAPATELAAAVHPAGDPAEGSADTSRSRSVSLDTQAPAGSAESSVSTTPTVPTSAPPTTTSTAGSISTTTTVTPPSTVVAVATTRPPTTSTTLLTLTLPTVAPLLAAAPPTTTGASARLVGHNDSGVASWFNAPDATCAHRTLPFGTMVKVTRVRTGATAFCKVDDRGPTVETGRLIDLSMDTFEKLAAPEAGLIDVNIEW